MRIFDVFLSGAHNCACECSKGGRKEGRKDAAFQHLISEVFAWHLGFVLDEPNGQQQGGEVKSCPFPMRMQCLFEILVASWFEYHQLTGDDDTIGTYGLPMPKMQIKLSS